MERPNVPGPLRPLVTSLGHTHEVEEAREVFKAEMRLCAASRPHAALFGMGAVS